MRTLISKLDLTPETPSSRPVPEFMGNVERQMAKRVGVTQFGVNHLTLAPGSMTSRRHWHEQEDEFVFVLSGQVTLHDENGNHELGAGDYVGFPGGAPNGHHLINRSGASAALLIVGTRKVGEERVHYPDESNPGPFAIVRDASGNRVG
jgi:uncharacterized cupin superfamily protein